MDHPQGEKEEKQLHSHFSLWCVFGAGDLELVRSDVTLIRVSENERAADRHLVGREGAGLVGADDAGATEGLHGGQRPHNGVLGGHATGAQGKARGDDGGQTFGDGSHREGDRDLEVVDGATHPRATVRRIVEVTDVDRPHRDADDRNDLKGKGRELSVQIFAHLTPTYVCTLY